MFGEGLIAGFVLIIGFVEGIAGIGILENSQWSAGYIQPSGVVMGLVSRILEAHPTSQQLGRKMMCYLS